MINQDQLLSYLQSLGEFRKQQDAASGSVAPPDESTPSVVPVVKNGMAAPNMQSFLSPSMPWQSPKNAGDLLGQQFNSSQYQMPNPSGQQYQGSQGGIMSLLSSFLG